MTTATELAALRAEVAALRGEVEALVRLVGIVYHAGRNDALHGIPPRKPPRRGRGELRPVR
jgi:hypothetical protein